MRIHEQASTPSLLTALAAAIAIGACSKATPPAQAPPPAPVIAMPVIQRDATITAELVGQVSAIREVPLRSQVTGTVQKILFEPGQRVTVDQPLFVIDPRSYQASLGEAQGALANAQATLARARQDVARYEPLLPYNAIPRATYDTAVATAKSAEAAVQQRQAAVERAQLDVRNAQVRSPATGQISTQQVEVGSLVVASQTVLATVSTLDPVYVIFNVPEAEYVRYRKSRGGEAAAERAASAQPLHITLPDGTPYRHAGKFDYIEPSVSGTTGTLAIRTRFPNPENLLRPGMNVRVRVVLEQLPNALLVPQRAVTELLGRQFVTVVGPGNKAEQRAVTLGERVDDLWVVQSGLQPGERVIVEGTQKAPPGTIVAPTMITEAQLDAPRPRTSTAPPADKK